MIGKKIDRYKITEKIGEGGMGSVWRAEDPNLGRDVALKFLPDSLANSAEARKRFLREGKAAATLQHPGIATVYDADEADGKVYIAFQLVNGETVSEHIAHGLLAVADACRVAFDAAEALDHAHARGVLHRDVTSRNIMIDRESRVIVVDFGLALPQGATRVTQEGSTVGTAPYLAPEVVTGGDGDERSDVYGLGVVLYEALTGKLPFDADRVDSLFYLVVHTDAEAPSAKREGIPAELDRVVMRALAKDPAERYGSAREFAKDLYAVLETASDRPPSDRWLTAPPPAPRAQPISERVKRIATKPITWVVLLIVAAAVGYGIWKPTPNPAPEQAFASVAVLPFENLTDAPAESAWLAEGIAEALAGRLTSLASIKVTPWFTSRNFRDPSKPPAEIATELNTEALVVGTVRQVGERLLCRVTVIDARKGSQWWAEEYKESLDDLFEVQQRIALGVARSISGQLSRADERQLTRPAAHSVEAYEHYLRGSALVHEGTQESVFAAIPFFERALELDPELADAYVGLGAAHSNLYDVRWGGAQVLHEAEQAFKKALALDPASTGAHRGLIRVYFDLGRSEEILKQGQAALLTNPDGIENMLAMGEAYATGGLPEKAIPLLRRVTELDPANEAAYWFLSWAYLPVGRYADAIEAIELYWRKFGFFVISPGIAYQALGDADAAELYFNRVIGNLDYLKTLSAAAFFLDTGEVDKAHAILTDGIGIVERDLRRYPDNLRARHFLAALWGMMGDSTRLQQELDAAGGGHSHLNVFVPAALARLGDIPSAAARLEDAAQSGCNMMAFLKWDPGLFPDGFFEHPDVQPALRALRELHDDLAARY